MSLVRTKFLLLDLENSRVDSYVKQALPRIIVRIKKVKLLRLYRIKKMSINLKLCPPQF